MDHVSGLMFIYNQVSLNVGKTLCGKRAFEQYALSCGVCVKSYRTNNHHFCSAKFLYHLNQNGQAITFSGVGAHHQNGVAKCAIQTVSNWAREMLLHAIIHWPDQSDLSLWPFAFEHAIFMWNNMPHQVSKVALTKNFASTSLADYLVLYQVHV